MKKILAILLAFVLVLGMAACGNETPKTTEAPVTTTKAPDQTPAASTPAADDKGYAPITKTSVYISAGPSGGNNFMICATLGACGSM